MSFPFPYKFWTLSLFLFFPDMGAGKCSSPACRCTAFKPMQTSYGHKSRLCTRTGCGHDMSGHGDPACRYIVGRNETLILSMSFFDHICYWFALFINFGFEFSFLKWMETKMKISDRKTEKKEKEKKNCFCSMAWAKPSGNAQWAFLMSASTVLLFQYW